MKGVWKFPLEIRDYVAVVMPAGAKILDVQLQGATPVIWAFVDETAPAEARHFRVLGTGFEADDIDPAKYVATVQDRLFVWHIFEV